MQNGQGNVKPLAAVALCGLTLLAATGLCRLLRPVEEPAPSPRSELVMPAKLFQGWPRLDLALALTAEQHGYMLPCGCSRPQVGGLERRYNFLQLLRGKGWPVVAVDLGDVPQHQGPRQLPNVQGLIKYRYSMEALKKMNYLAVGLGEQDASLSLDTLLGEFALNNETPAVLAANVRDRDDFKKADYQVKTSLVKEVPGTRLKVGVVSLIDPSLGDRLKAYKVQLDDPKETARVVLKEFADRKADLHVLLYHGSIQKGQAFAREFPAFHIIQCLSPETDASSDPVRVGETMIVGVGQKGRNVGVVGVNATGKADKPFELRYQLVALGEEFLTPEAEQPRQPILKLMEDYARELRSDDYLAKHGQMKHPSQVAIAGAVPTYVGTEKCKKCHETAFVVWEGSKHAHAFESLEKAKLPSLRHLDAECVACHVVGFGYESGYRSEKATPHLKQVGCESCHGPASEHVKNTKDERWYTVLNPWRPGKAETPREKEQRKLRANIFCQSCHDQDNDVHWDFDKRWKDVAHPTAGE